MIDLDEIARWNDDQRRAREEYRAHPTAFAWKASDTCESTTICPNKSGRSRLCWKHRNEARRVRSAA